MNTQVFIVDREDQAKWYVDTKTALHFCIQLENNHKALRDWLVDMSQGVVVVCGQGTLPRPGGVDHPTRSIFEHIQRDQFKVYFQDEKDALAFKLAWGGSI